MDDIAAQLLRAGISETEIISYLQQVQTFCAQVHRAFASAHASEVRAALDLMIELHVDQARRPDGTLYIAHPLAVASQVLAAMVSMDREVVIAALLHDSVEDQAAKLAGLPGRSVSTDGLTRTQQALEAIEVSTRSARVRDLVAGLSNPDFAAQLAERGIERGIDEESQMVYLRARNALYAEHVFQAIRDPDRALIKLYDLVANALTLDALPDAAMRSRLLQKYMPVLAIMLDRLQETAHPLNIIAQRQEQLRARLSDALRHFQS